MSMLDSYFSGWRFRSTTPSLEPGREVNVFMYRHDGDGVGIAEVGDTRLYVEGAGPEHVEKRVRVEVTSFDPAESAGEATFKGVVGESSYAG